MYRTAFVSVFSVGLLASLANAQETTPYSDDRSSPGALISSLYNAIDREEFARAFSYFAEPPAETVEAYSAGFSNTEHVEIVTGVAAREGAAGSIYYQQPVVIRSTDTNGAEQILSGCYVVRQVNPQNAPDDFTPMQIESGSLEPTETAFEEAMPTRCGADGDALPPTDLGVERSKTVFEQVFSSSCRLIRDEGSENVRAPDVYDIEFRQMSDMEDDPLRTVRLYRHLCDQGAYNEAHIYMFENEEGEIAPLQFASPELDIRYEDDDIDKALESVTMMGTITRTRLINSQFDQDTMTLTSDEKWRGAGDAGASGQWIFRYGQFTLVHYEVDASYDGAVNPEIIIDSNTGP